MSKFGQAPYRDPAGFATRGCLAVALAQDHPAGSVIEPHRHRRAQLIYAAEGVMTVSAEAGSWVVPPQRAVWLPAGMGHRVTMNRTVKMRSLYVRPDAAPDLPSGCRVLAVTPLLRALILRAMELPADYPAEGPEARLVRVLLDEMRALPAAPLHLPEPADPRLVRVTDALHDKPGDRRSLADWAALAGASPRTLARLFLAETGLSFRAWRQRARMLQALVGLAAHRPVTVLALELGYDSPSAFIAAFRQVFGVTPARYFARPEATGDTNII
ncbi:MAG TPA: helix-turn-helix transcriptional regulator [Kiloniellales bacterium]|nr:helix-turn-helix transcriptional regulator [Kiloniellales bacterium]